MKLFFDTSALVKFFHEEQGTNMKVGYDKEADAAYIQLSSKHPEGGVEISEGVILHTTEKDQIVAIEILDASRKFPIRNLYKLEVTAG